MFDKNRNLSQTFVANPTETIESYTDVAPVRPRHSSQRIVSSSEEAIACSRTKLAHGKVTKEKMITPSRFPTDVTRVPHSADDQATHRDGPEQDDENPVDPPDLIVGKKVRDLRQILGLNQREFGAELSYARETISKIETGVHRATRKFIDLCRDKWAEGEELARVFEEVFPNGHRRTRARAQVPSETPDAIARYLELFPAFDVRTDLMRQYVRTSHESFMVAAECILSRLSESDTVFAATSLVFDRPSIGYWPGEGMRYLELNYLAAQRGVRITRVFVVSRGDRRRHSDLIDEIGRLHKCAGVVPMLAEYETLRGTFHCEFVIFGNRFVDEAFYDFQSNIVDNLIHWSDHKLASFREKQRLLLPLVDSRWSPRGQRARSFDAVTRLAREIRGELPDVGQ